MSGTFVTALTDARAQQMHAAADLLITAHQGGAKLDWLPQECSPRTLQEAYAVQELVRSELEATDGWKVGAATSESEPFAAPLLASRIGETGIEIQAGQFNMFGIEGELAFRLAGDLPPRAAPYTLDEIHAAVGSLHAAIELVDSRLPDWESADNLWRMADNGSNGYLVLGSGITDWLDMPLEKARVRLDIDGRPAVEQEGGNTGGDPVRLLVYLVNHCREHRGGLKAGDVITTGSFTGLSFGSAPSRFRVSFPDVGEAELVLAE